MKLGSLVDCHKKSAYFSFYLDPVTPKSCLQISGLCFTAAALHQTQFQCRVPIVHFWHLFIFSGVVFFSKWFQAFAEPRRRCLNERLKGRILWCIWVQGWSGRTTKTCSPSRYVVKSRGWLVQAWLMWIMKTLNWAVWRHLIKKRDLSCKKSDLL